MTIVVTDPAVGEALTLAETKAHLRVDTDAEDGLIEALIRTAREHMEAETGLVLLTKGLRLHLDDWPKAHAILIRRHPLRTLEAVTIYDDDGLPEAVDLDRVALDTSRRPARLVLRDVPSAGREINGIEIDFTAGFGDSGAEVPDTLKRAMLLHIACMYEMRGAVTASQQPAAIPEGYDRLTGPYRRRAL
jgi:uncharacterized phiE125 gp8 family phage protein